MKCFDAMFVVKSDFTRAIIFQYLRSMNNYTGVFEVNSALRSAEVYRLDHTVKKLFKEKEEILNEVRSFIITFQFFTFHTIIALLKSIPS